MKCEICGKGPRDGTSIYRTGLKGPGHDPHWRCQMDMDGKQLAAVPQDVMQTVAEIEATQHEGPKQ